MHRRVHLLGCDQYDGLKLHGPCGVDRQGERRGRDTIRHVSNDEKIIAAIGIIKGFEGAPEGLHQLRHRVAPFRSTLAEDASQPLYRVGTLEKIFWLFGNSRYS